MTGRKKSSPARRSKNLSDDAIEQIVRILDGWSGRLTWNALIEAIAPHLYFRYTRQALHKHERIRAAYALRKDNLGKRLGSGGSRLPPDAADQIARLRTENQRLEAENERLLEQFVVWAYNAHARGLDKGFLSQPLPRVNRGQTSPELKRKRRS